MFDTAPVGCYVVENRVNGKLYVGQTIQGFERRFAGHVKSARQGSDSHFHNAIRKHGVENFCLVVWISAQDKESLNGFEKFTIARFETTKPAKGYNMTFGGDVTEMTAETRAKNSAAHKGQRPWNKGKEWPAEIRAKISATKRKAAA